MNFDEVQMIWDSQKNEPAFKIDKETVVRIVEKQSIAVHRDLKILELTAIAVLLFLGVSTLIDTFFNGQEYFQLWSVAFEFVAAGFLWLRRGKRERGIPAEPLSLMQRIDVAVGQIQATVQRGRDMATVFSIFVLYGVVIRVWIYGWRGSEVKAVAALICVGMLWLGMTMAKASTHGPRMRSLRALREQLLEVSEAPAEE